MSRVDRTVAPYTLASGGAVTTTPVACDGAIGVYISVSCDVNHQLSTANPVLTMQGGNLTITGAPGTINGGGAQITDARTPLNAAGTFITLDLSAATHYGMEIRYSNATAFSGYTRPLVGVLGVGLSLVKAATAGNAVYTVTTSVYYA